MTIERLCVNCVFEDTSKETTVCKTCLLGRADHFMPKAALLNAEPGQAIRLPDGVSPAGVPVPVFTGTTPIKTLDNSPSNDGSTASYYVLPEGAKELQDLIAYRNLNAQMGEILRACYRYGQGHHSPRERDLKKIIFYAQAELDRLAKYG